MHPLDVYKRLPQNNCGKCAAGTCIAFSIQLLRSMVSLDDCKELDDENRKAIEQCLTEEGDWKDKRFKELLEEVSRADLHTVAKGIGARFEDGILRIPYMGRAISLRRKTFTGEVSIWDKLLILMYIKRGGRGPLSGQWVAFRDLKDGMIRAEGFHHACEIPLAQLFDQGTQAFLKKLNAVNAKKIGGYPAAHSYVIHVLPMVPFLILIWPGNDEMHSECKILLDLAATRFLDIEALLYLGIAFVGALTR